MNATPTCTDFRLAKIDAALAAASGKWTGCDWPTQFAASRLNLNGLHPSQALLMARATAGAEAADWRSAADWLRRLEEDASEAETEGRTAARLAREGRISESLEWARRACATEGHYRSPRTWQPLCNAIEAILAADDGQKSDSSGL